MPESGSLNESVSILKANEVPISIAGIISQKEFSYSVDTKSLLIEGSIFNSTNIRQQSRTLGLRTDRSARYEKSLKNINISSDYVTITPYVARYFIEKISSLQDVGVRTIEKNINNIKKEITMKNLPKLGGSAGRKTGLAQTLSTLVLTVTVAFVASIILAWPVKWLWNWLVPGIFGGIQISVAQAWGLILLAQLLIPRSLAPTGQAKNSKS